MFCLRFVPNVKAKGEKPKKFHAKTVKVKEKQKETKEKSFVFPAKVQGKYQYILPATDVMDLDLFVNFSNIKTSLNQSWLYFVFLI